MSVTATMVVVLAGLSACGSSTSPGSTASGSSTTGGATSMSLWTNVTTGDGVAFWKSTVKDFEAAHPGVTITIQSIQNENYDGKLQTAMNSGDAPDIFMQRGGGKLAAQVAAGQVMDITNAISADTKKLVSDGSFQADQVDGKTYAMPVSVLPEGIFYSKDLFTQAGITATPTTIAELEADVSTLKSKGITPIALGAKDAWPAAHWYYQFALRECSQTAMATAASTKKFSDPCWLKAGEDLKAFAATDPFNKGFLTTSAQQGAGSSAGLVANHKAAMELMGAWDPGVMASLTSDQKPLGPRLVPVPERAAAARVTPNAMMAGNDGLLLLGERAAALCTDSSTTSRRPRSRRPTTRRSTRCRSTPAAQAVVDAPYLDRGQGVQRRSYVSLCLDTLYGQNVGNALNTRW